MNLALLEYEFEKYLEYLEATGYVFDENGDVIPKENIKGLVLEKVENEK